MPSRRVIQDSDEEDNANDSPVRNTERMQEQPSTATSTAAINLSSSPHPNLQVPSGGPSTGSTELLNREIKDAYNSLLEPSASRSSRSSHPSSGSPSVSRRRATTEFGEKPVKTPKVTYGGRKSKDDSASRFNIEDEELVRRHKRVRLNGDVTKASRDELAEAVDRYNTSSGLLGNFGKSDGSGRSNNAASLKGYQEQAQDAPTMVAQSMLLPAPKSSGASQQQLDSSIGSTWPYTERASSPLPVGNPTSATPRTRKRALSDLESPPKIILGEEIPPSSSAPASSPVKRVRIDTGSQDHASSTSTRHLDGGHDELSLSAVSSPRSTRTQSKQHKTETHNTEQEDRDFALALKLQEEEEKEHAAHQRRRLGDTSQTTEPASDDLTPDLPAERYQPRPSRSRSARTVDDLVVPSDFSKRPEALTKKKEKAKAKGKGKQKKSAVLEELEEDVDESPIQAEDHQLVPDLKTMAHGEERPDDDTHVTNIQAAALDDTSKYNADTTDPQQEEPTLPPSPPPPPTPNPPKPKKSRGRPKKDTSASATGGFPETTTINVPLEEDNATALSNSKSVELAPTTRTPAKRGRKKKKHAVSEDIVVDDEDPPRNDDPPQTEKEIEIEIDPEKGGVLKEVAVNIPPPAPPLEAQLHQGNPNSPSSPKKKESVPGAVEAVLKVEVKKEIATPSPAKDNGLGKATYRVGLSKRQRIAPLLKVMRK
ncbi:MAG: hypothetical protein Q9218_008032 [Villophora microphyllina]